MQNYVFQERWKVHRFFRMIIFSLVFCCVVVSLTAAVSAATTEVHIVRYAADNVTVIKEKTWNAAEDKNVQEKDMGAVKGTSLKDLCDLAGGMAPGDVVKIKADDGFTKTFAYENIYKPPARQGPMAITWYHDVDGYVPDYRTGMRLVFFADNSTNPWGIHAFGNNDWRQSAASEYWYYYRQGDEKYPTTTGLSIQYVSDILIYSTNTTPGKPAHTTTAPVAAPTQAGISPFAIVCALAICGFFVNTNQKRE